MMEHIIPIVKFKTTMLQSSLCNYSDTHVLVKGIIKVAGTSAAAAAASNANKKVICANCAPFTDRISKINDTQRDNAKAIDVVIPMYTLIGYSNNYSKRSWSLWQYYRDKPVLDDNGNIIDFTDNSTSDSFKIKEKIAD